MTYLGLMKTLRKISDCDVTRKGYGDATPMSIHNKPFITKEGMLLT